MKLTEIEKQFKQFVDSVKSNEMIEEAEQGKDKIWFRVSQQMPDRGKTIAMWTIAAASVLLILLTAFAYNNIHSRDEIISQLTSELETLENNRNQLAYQVDYVKKQLKLLQTQPPQIDTVYKTKIVYRDAPDRPKEMIANELAEEKITNQDKNRPMIIVGEDVLDLASIQNDVESFQIKYGQKAKNGVVPWTFTVKYQ